MAAPDVDDSPVVSISWNVDLDITSARKALSEIADEMERKRVKNEREISRQFGDIPSP
jgi:hypothetical protein